MPFKGKFFISICYCTFVLAFSVSLSHAEQEFFPFLAITTADKINVRAGQSHNFERIDRLKKDQDVVVVGREYSWYKIELPDHAANFISDKYVELIDDTQGLVTGDRVNVRAAPRNGATVLTQVKENDQVTIIEHLDGWLKITPPEGSYGWVKKDLLSFKSKNIPKEEIVDKKEEKVKEEAKVKQPEKQEEEPAVPIVEKESLYVTVTGRLKKDENIDYENIQFKLVIDGKTAYYLNGATQILDQFKNYKVHCEGELVDDYKERPDFPVINVKKVHLVL